MNFEALKFRFPELSLVGEQVETLFLEEHYAQCIAQGRVFAEGALRKRLSITDGRMMLAAMMTTNAFLRLPSEVQGAYKRLRRQGNQGAHYSEGKMMALQDAKLAEDVLRSCWVVAQDLYKMKNTQGLYPEFVLPTYEVEPAPTPEKRPTFNEEQEKVIALTQGRHLVLAPPGCGKTAVLTERVIHAMQEGVAPASMLCLTFTNRATMNMKERIEARSSAGAVSGLFVGNLHKFCAHFLYEHALVDERTQIIDEDDVAEIIQSFLPEGMDSAHRNAVVTRVRAINNRENLLKAGASDNLLPPITRSVPKRLRDTLTVLGFVLYDEWDDFTISEVSSLYQQYKEDNVLIDFNDMLSLTFEYLQRHKELRHQYSWIQIDEVQDLSELQLALVMQLWNANTPQSVLVYFGDEQQAIYSFLGAKVQTLSELAQSGATVHRLFKNYRSPKYLLDLFNAYAHNVLRYNSKWLPQAVIEGKAHKDALVWQWADPEHLDLEVVRTLTQWKKQNETTTSAVIVSRNDDADALSLTLKDHHIPHFKVSGADVFNYPLMKTAKAYLSVLNTPTQVNAWAQVAQGLLGGTRKRLRELFMEAYRTGGWLPSDWLLYPQDPETREPHSLVEDLYQRSSEGIVLWRLGRVLASASSKAPIDYPCVSALKLQGFGASVTAQLQIITAKNPDRFDRDEVEKLYSFTGEAPVVFVSDDAMMLYNSYLVRAENELGQKKKERWFFSDLLNAFEPALHEVLGRDLMSSFNPSEKVKNYCSQLGLPSISGVPNHFQPYATLLSWMVEHAESLLEKQQQFFNKYPKLREYANRLRQKCGDVYRSHVELMDVISDKGNESMLGVVFLEFLLHLASNVKDDGNGASQNFIEKAPLVLEYIEKVLVNKTEQQTLRKQLRAYLIPFLSLKEADLCSTDIVKERIFIATVHRAKGLEFDNVLVYDVREGLYPWLYPDSIELGEAARRLYVAITRAKAQIKLLIPQGRNSQGYLIRPSRYLESVDGFFTKLDRY